MWIAILIIYSILGILTASISCYLIREESSNFWDFELSPDNKAFVFTSLFLWPLWWVVFTISFVGSLITRLITFISEQIKISIERIKETEQ